MATVICQLVPYRRDISDAESAIRDYRQILRDTAAVKLDSQLSVSLSQFEMWPTDTIADVIYPVLYDAIRTGSVLFIEAEGAYDTPATMDLAIQLSRVPGCADRIGMTLYADLYRTESDLRHLLTEAVRIKLSRQVFRESPQVAVKSNSAVRAKFIQLITTALRSGKSEITIATCDPGIIDETIRFATAKGVAPGAFEFQMLYGLRTYLQQQLVHNGWRVRVFTPYGQQVYPYVARIVTGKLLRSL